MCVLYTDIRLPRHFSKGSNKKTNVIVFFPLRRRRCLRVIVSNVCFLTIYIYVYYKGRCRWTTLTPTHTFVYKFVCGCVMVVRVWVCMLCVCSDIHDHPNAAVVASAVTRRTDGALNPNGHKVDVWQNRPFRLYSNDREDPWQGDWMWGGLGWWEGRKKSEKGTQ